MTAVLDTTDAATCAVRPKNLPRPKPISVDGVTIPRDAIAREVQNHPAAKPVDAWRKAAEALVVRELLLQEARRIPIAAAPLTDDEGRRETEEEALVHGLIAREVVTPKADTATCRRYYEANRQRFRSADIYALRHILIAAAPGDTEGRAAGRQLAERILSELKADLNSFATLAAAHSACPSREVGGSLGQVTRGQTVPEFEAALSALPVGAVPDAPVETRYGFHVVVVDRRIEGAPLPFEAVEGAIARWLDERARHTAIRQYIAMLAGRASITGIEITGAATPLAQ